MKCFSFFFFFLDSCQQHCDQITQTPSPDPCGHPAEPAESVPLK